VGIKHRQVKKVKFSSRGGLADRVKPPLLFYLRANQKLFGKAKVWEQKSGLLVAQRKTTTVEGR